MFRAVPLSIIRSFSVYTQQWYMSYRFADCLRAGSEWNSCCILILLASCQQTFMTYTIAVCTVKNSWWWTEELSETCRFSNKSTNQMQQFFKFIAWRLLVCTAQHVSGVLTPIIRISTTAVAAYGYTVGAWW